MVAEVHPRMPVMLKGQAMWDWLSETDAKKRLSLLQPFDPGQMRSWEVSRAVNSPAQDDASLIQPLENGLFD